MKNGKKSVTLKDLASATGFSANTVSRALADKPDISKETKALIRKKAGEMGYIANALASFLRSGVSKVISIIVGDISNPHFSVMVKEIQTRLQKQGYTTIIFNTEEKNLLERQAITTSISQNVDGVLICPAPGGAENIRLLQAHGVPFVLIGRSIGGVEASHVVCDDEHSGYIATKALLAKGHRAVLFLNGPRGISSADQRLYGYRRAMEEAGIPPNPQLVRTIPITAGQGAAKLRQVLTETPDYTAVLAFSDLVAWEAVCVLERIGRPVPKACSVAGFDNIRFTYPVRLNSVAPTRSTMGRKAVELLLREIADHTQPKERLVLETALVEGDTVCQL